MMATTIVCNECTHYAYMPPYGLNRVYGVEIAGNGVDCDDDNMEHTHKHTAAHPYSVHIVYAYA